MDLTNFKPLLAAKIETEEDYNKLQYPLLASPKIDGIRTINHPERGPITRTLKPIPNKYIREYLAHPKLKWLDGETVVGNPRDVGLFNKTQSAVMSQSGTPDFTYYVFDHLGGATLSCPFNLRLNDAREAVAAYGLSSRVRFLEHVEISNRLELDLYEGNCVARGYEGIMLRSPKGRYKFNRSTLRDGILIKLKRFEDAEAIIIGWEPLERNENAPTIDALGYQKRSAHQAGKVTDDTLLGKFLVRGLGGRWANVEFSIGSGLTEALRREYRNCIDLLIAKKQVVTYKYQAHGSKDAPRMPIFKGLRHD